MSIVSSTFTAGHAQRDGRRYVVESHTDSLGAVHQTEYLADVAADCAAIMAERAAALSEALADAEAMELIDGP